jgi:hypothetical protein
MANYKTSTKNKTQLDNIQRAQNNTHNMKQQKQQQKFYSLLKSVTISNLLTKILILFRFVFCNNNSIKLNSYFNLCDDDNDNNNDMYSSTDCLGKILLVP